MADSPNARRVQDAAPRATEGRDKSTANKSKLSSTHTERKRGRGRPKGSKNKPKALIPAEVAKDLLGVVKQSLPPELYEEMKKAVKDGKNISTLNEARILMKLMGPPVWQRLIEEVKPHEASPVILDPDLQDEIGDIPTEGKPGFDRDLNERLKVLINLMQFVAKLEQNDEAADSSEKPILEIIARRGLDSERVKFLVGVESGPVGRDSDGTGREPITVRAVSDSVSERPLDVQDNEQGQTVRVLDPDSIGSLPRSSDEA